MTVITSLRHNRVALELTNTAGFPMHPSVRFASRKTNSVPVPKLSSTCVLLRPSTCLLVHANQRSSAAVAPLPSELFPPSTQPFSGDPLDIKPASSLARISMCVLIAWPPPIRSSVRENPNRSTSRQEMWGGHFAVRAERGFDAFVRTGAFH